MSAGNQKHVGLGTPGTNGQVTFLGLGEPSSVLAHRKEAWDAFRRLSTPGRSEEAWRYLPGDLFFNEEVSSEFHRVAPTEHRPGAPAVLLNSMPTLCDLYCHCEASESGLSLPEGVFCQPVLDFVAQNEDFAERIFMRAHSRDKFDQLINSLFTDGVYLKAERGIAVSDCVGIHSPIPPGLVKVGRSHIELSESSEGNFLIWIDGGGDNSYYYNWLTVDLCENSHLSLTIIQNADSSARILSRVHGRVNKDASLMINAVNIGGGIVRNELTVETLGVGAQAQLFGLTLAGGRQRFGVFTSQQHHAPRCTTRLRFKQVFMDKSRGVFDGIIEVPVTSPATDAFQENHNIILSKDAKVNSIPRLEINTDDVRCTHGATVRYVLPNEVFYLRSRGLRESVAKHLLVSSFLEEISGKINVESVRTYIENVLEEKVRGGIGN